MEAKYNLWIEHEGQVVLSAWRADLLEAIDEAGSISAAAERLKVPYRRAWEKVQEIEAGLGVKVVATAVGGAGGGGAHLTAAGRTAYQSVEPPGTPVTEPPASPITPSDGGRGAFAIVTIVLDRFEWLDLAVRGHRRARHVRNGSDWQGRWLVP